MSIYPFIVEHAQKDEVFQFLKKNGVEVLFDFNGNTFNNIWNEIYFDGKKLLQIDQGLTVEEFKQVIAALQCEEKECEEKLKLISKIEFRLNIPDENLPAVKLFAEKFKDILSE